MLYIGIVKQFVYSLPVSLLLKCLLALIINEFAAFGTGWWNCYYTLSLRSCAVLVLIVRWEQMVKFMFVGFLSFV